MQRIIFLDIDGVLNCQVFYEKIQKGKGIIEHPENQICHDRVQWLNELCKDTNCKVVISSTWRYSGFDYCKDVLNKCGATFEIIGITTSLMKSDYSVRGNEILAWIRQNEKLVGKDYEYHQYAIIDDDSDMLLWQKDNFFQTDSYSGLTPNTCHKIKLFFKKFDQSCHTKENTNNTHTTTPNN